MTSYLWLLPVGVLIGAFGTLIGAGGGFVLTPLLLLVYPHESPEIITSISLAVVFFNAFSGSVAYARMQRIDYRSGVLFALATIPGAVLGALTTTYMPRRAFDLVFGLCMLLAALFLLLRRETSPQPATQPPSSHHVVRSVIEADGTQHTFSYNLRVGHRSECGCGLFFQSPGHWRWHYPRAGDGVRAPFPCAYRHSHVPLYPGRDGVDRHAGAHGDRGVSPWGAAHHRPQPWGAYRRPTRRAVLAPCAGTMDLAIVGDSPGVGRDTDPRARIRLVDR